MQPGSSCVTSLIEAESIPKHVALLEITGTDFHVTPIPIQNVFFLFSIPIHSRCGLSFSKRAL